MGLFFKTTLATEFCRDCTESNIAGGPSIKDQSTMYHSSQSSTASGILRPLKLIYNHSTWGAQAKLLENTVHWLNYPLCVALIDNISYKRFQTTAGHG